MAQQKLSVVARKFITLCTVMLTTFGILEAAMAMPAQSPLFLTQPVRPIMMLNMSLDHQLFFKLYDDYSDLDGDGSPDTTYMHRDGAGNEYHYYGYFDSAKCYVYDSNDNRFEPTRFASSDNYCNDGNRNNEWSGNFLNWATMTRMDAVRKILYGGKRSTDTASTTVLERAFLPQDAHAFAKYYGGSDLNRLTPFDGDLNDSDPEDRGITICNTTEPNNRNVLSQNVTAPPRMQVAEGNFSLWASNERWQCRWDINSNDNDSSKSGIYAHSNSPRAQYDKLGNYVVRVQACVSGLITDADNSNNYENCRAYDGNHKPAGLLQAYGEDDSIHFGLMTGSYGKNKSGGVLRKQVGNIANEVNSDGTFDIDNNENTIIGTLDVVRIYGYDFNGGTYHESAGADDNCPWALSSFSNGNCSNWGNPQSEIYLESLRYLAGLSANSDFATDDSSRISGLYTAAWGDGPITDANYCAPTSVIQFNASTSSYDGDNLSGASTLNGAPDIDTWTDKVGAGEGIHGKTFFIGENGTNDGDDQLCTPKTVSSLSDAEGTCPDAPRLEGSYQIAGLAYYAHTNSIRAGRDQKVKTYGVALAPAVPRVTIPVPGDNDKSVTILPACRNKQMNPDANCAIVDFKIVEQTSSSGKLYVNWEDSEQGGDYDQDMWGVINYTIDANKIDVVTEVIAQSTGDPMGFGYVISGTTDDGFHVHSGVNNFTYGLSCTNSWDNRCTCRSSGTNGRCDISNIDRSKSFTIGTSDAKLLEQPLYYAAKWGGFDIEDGVTEPDVNAEPETYFYATDPRELEAALESAFASVASSVGSASAVATNSTRLSEGSYLYQARFNSKNWTGELLAFEYGTQGDLKGDPISTNDTMHTGVVDIDSRRVYTYDGDSRADFQWVSLPSSLQDFLRENDDSLSDSESEALAKERIRWLRGESVEGLRERELSGTNELLLGDIVNSSPAYLGGRDMRYDRLPGEAGINYRSWLLNTKRDRDPQIFVGANDGMFHAFDAETLEEDFAYIPTGVYPKLANITLPSYGKAGSGNPHQYLVDGPVAIGDVYIDNEWRTIVVGTLGAGGQGIFALDVTDGTPSVIFDYNNIDGSQPIGYVMGQPYIVPLKDGSDVRWAVVFGNGYEADSTSLAWIYLDNPDTIHTIDASDTGKGLSTPALLPNGQGIIEAAYAGDLEGNLWKFDLSSASSSDWYAEKLFAAVSDEGDPQPITAAPELGVNAQKDFAIMVYFGTGRYIYDNDNTSSVPAQTFYAIVDKGTEIDRDDLPQKVIALSGSTRSVTSESFNWEDVDGWYMNLPTSGERVTTKAMLLYDKLVFSTLIPSAIPCQYGGSSWIMEVPAIGDRYTDTTVVDSQYNNFLIMGELGLGVLPPPPPPPEPPEEPPGEDGGGEDNGDDDDGGSKCDPSEIAAKIYALGSTGVLESKDACLPGSAFGRMSWRQLR